MNQIIAYITFKGNTKEAMEYYNECLGGELTIQLIKDSPIAAECSGDSQNDVMHSMIKKGNMMLMASDMIGHHQVTFGDNISLNYNCISEEEVKNSYEYFAKDGTIIHPLQVEFWGATFGVVKDKFGVNWMFHYDKNFKI